jgi:hypothetical protein
MQKRILRVWVAATTFLFSTVATGATPGIFIKTAHYGGSLHVNKIQDGDYSAIIDMDLRLKLTRLLGEPVVNCYHKITWVRKVYYQGLELNVPNSVKRRIRADYDVFAITIEHNSTRANVFCQSGLDNGLGKWSTNFPGSPDWHRFLFTDSYIPPSMSYWDFKERVSFLPVSRAKKLLGAIIARPREFSIYGIGQFPHVGRGDLSAVAKWHQARKKKELEREAAKNRKYVAARRKQQKAVHEKVEKNDFFAEMDNEIYREKTTAELNTIRKDVYGPLRALEQKYDRDSEASRAAFRAKRTRIAKLRKQDLRAIIEARRTLEPFRDEDTDKWGYRTKSGEVVIKPRFFRADRFSENDTAVVILDTRDEAAGCGHITYGRKQKIDRSGSFVGSSWEEKLWDRSVCIDLHFTVERH